MCQVCTEVDEVFFIIRLTKATQRGKEKDNKDDSTNKKDFSPSIIANEDLVRTNKWKFTGEKTFKHADN